jgi:eukaryotic-like serine/threonine-protein kinase
MPQRCLGCSSPLEETFRACPHCGDVVTDFARLYSAEPLDGKYQIVERLGAGGMGEVYRALHTHLGVTRVIKVVRSQISESADAHERFLREARAATKVQHPNVAVLHDFSALPDGSHYMVWEYIDGENLAQRLRAAGTLPLRQALRIAIQAGQGLEAIHRAGIIHRDISPENLMITRDEGTVKIIDLGVAKVEDPSETASTQTGIFVGKLRYASPEQLGFLPPGERVDARADVYALGMVLYEMLVGRPPYEAKSPHEYFLLHAREPAEKTAPLPADLPAAVVLQSLLDRALARDRNHRFSRAGELAAALEEVDVLVAGEQTRSTAVFAADGDETLKQITEPYKHPVPAGAAAATLRTGVQAAGAKRSYAPVALVAGVVVLILALSGYLMWPRSGSLPSAPDIEAPLPVVPASTTSETTSPPHLSEAVFSVVAPLETDIAPVEAPAVASIETAPQPPRTTPRVPVELASVVRAEPAAAAINPVTPSPADQLAPPAPAPEISTYIDGGGDGNVNRAMILQLREEVKGIRTVEVHAGAMQEQLVRSLKDHMPHLEIVSSAAVVIRFEGTLERLGMGRKRREGRGTVTRDGKVVFSYELPDQVFRVGMTPYDAFSRVLSDAFLR